MYGFDQVMKDLDGLPHFQYLQLKFKSSIVYEHSQIISLIIVLVICRPVRGILLDLQENTNTERVSEALSRKGLY